MPKPSHCTLHFWLYWSFLSFRPSWTLADWVCTGFQSVLQSENWIRANNIITFSPVHSLYLWALSCIPEECFIVAKIPKHVSPSSCKLSPRKLLCPGKLLCIVWYLCTTVTFAPCTRGPLMNLGLKFSRLILGVHWSYWLVVSPAMLHSVFVLQTKATLPANFDYSGMKIHPEIQLEVHLLFSRILYKTKSEIVSIKNTEWLFITESITQYKWETGGQHRYMLSLLRAVLDSGMKHNSYHSHPSLPAQCKCGEPWKVNRMP